VTVGEYRAWLREQGPAAEQVLEMLADAPDNEVMDPPTGIEAVYITTDRAYARWYAARSQGDLYRVVPVGEAVRLTEDLFPTWTTEAARVARVEVRAVRLTDTERKQLLRRWHQLEVAAGLRSEEVHRD
jgi:hypothetical protein